MPTPFFADLVRELTGLIPGARFALVRRAAEPSGDERQTLTIADASGRTLCRLCAARLAWYHWNAVGQPERKKFIAHRLAYHGNTIASASLPADAGFRTSTATAVRFTMRLREE